MADSYLSCRDFDYGVRDEVRHAVEQLRAEIATRIRQAAYLDPAATGRDQFAYEIAARIAEGLESSDRCVSPQARSRMPGEQNLVAACDISTRRR
jgi:hypothetical protein